MAADARSPRRTVPLAAGAVALALLTLLAWPALAWATSLGRAGALLERGLAWPAPRLADSLPQPADGAALDEAVPLLEAAQRARPDHPHAFRLAAYAAWARGDIRTAAQALEAAHARAPRSPLIAWEAGLAYEQILRADPADPTSAARIRELWGGAGFDAGTLRARAAESRAAGDEPQARRWDERAALMDG
jgi:hypothetical protein